MLNVINVFMCVRNNEDTLETTFNLLNQIQIDNKEYEFRYYVYENDSKDNTKSQVINFYRSHKGTCVFENLKNKQWGNVKDANRVFDMSIYRKKMKNLCKNYNNSYYSIVLDTNITFNPSIFQDMIKVFDQDRGIHMVTPFGYVEGRQKLYYDTFALDLESVYKGTNLKKMNYEMQKKQIIQLKSGFSGFIMIKTETLKKCNWKHSNVYSEHNEFCKEVREFGDIVCASHIKVKWKK